MRKSGTPGERREDLAAGAVAAASGARAAGLLAGACRGAPSREKSPALEVVRDLAMDVERQMDALARSIEGGAGGPDLLAEAALRCADLATLAASHAERLRPGAAAVVHLTAGAAYALRVLVEAECGDPGDEHAENLLRDVRGVEWRVNLAVRQIGESKG